MIIGELIGYVFRIPPEGRSGTARKWLARNYTRPEWYRKMEDFHEEPRDATITRLDELSLKSRMRFEYLAGKGDVSMLREHLV